MLLPPCAGKKSSERLREQLRARTLVSWSSSKCKVIQTLPQRGCLGTSVIYSPLRHSPLFGTLGAWLSHWEAALNPEVLSRCLLKNERMRELWVMVTPGGVWPRQAARSVVACSVSCTSSLLPGALSDSSASFCVSGLVNSAVGLTFFPALLSPALAPIFLIFLSIFS